MKIIATCEDDWMDLKQVRLAALKDSPDSFGATYEEAIKLTPEEWQFRASEAQDPRFIIAYNQDKPVGLIGGGLHNDEYEMIAMWVSPDHRGTGVGIALVDGLKQQAVSQGHSEIVLRVSPYNLSACRAYEKCGFEIVGNAGTLDSNEDIELQKMAWSTTIQP